MEYIQEIKERHSLDALNRDLKRFKDLKVLVIGDIIIDQYVFVEPKGRAIKDPILSVEYTKHETYAGGILAIANHISDFVKKVQVVSIIGDLKDKKKFIDGALNEKISLKTFIKKNSPTTVKKRYIDEYRNNKLFKVEYINDSPINNELSKEIINYLISVMCEYDLVVIGDFGHGFINDSIRRTIEENSKFLAMNVQSNSANMGYNYVNHYKKADFITMNESELRMPLMKRFTDIKKVIFYFHDTFKYDSFLLTRGKKGLLFFNKGELYEAPSVVETVVDTVGAGDAVFAITSLFSYINADPELIAFIGNCAGGVKAKYMANKESINKEKLINFIGELYNNEMGNL